MYFVAVAGQRDNVGDSLLRRPMLASAGTGTPRHVFVGRNAQSFVPNLGIKPGDRIYTSKARWLLELIYRTLTQRTNLLLNSGEIIVGLRFVVDRLPLVPLLGLIRLRGGVAALTGVGIRKPGQGWSWGLRAIATAFTFVAWRDAESREAAGVGEIAPDWGFAEGSHADRIAARFRDDRQCPPKFVISLRGDTDEPSPEWITYLRAAIAELGAQPVVVCQVRRDTSRAQWLAAVLGCDLVAWPADLDHAQQEQRLRNVYSSSTWVASDRLHVVIAAYTEGCVPLDLVPDGAAKVRRTLAAARVSLSSPGGARQRLTDDRRVLIANLSSARAQLGTLSSRISRDCSLAVSPDPSGAARRL